MTGKQDEYALQTQRGFGDQIPELRKADSSEQRHVSSKLQDALCKMVGRHNPAHSTHTRLTLPL